MANEISLLIKFNALIVNLCVKLIWNIHWRGWPSARHCNIDLNTLIWLWPSTSIGNLFIEWKKESSLKHLANVLLCMYVFCNLLNAVRCCGLKSWRFHSEVMLVSMTNFEMVAVQILAKRIFAKDFFFKLKKQKILASAAKKYFYETKSTNSIPQTIIQHSTALSSKCGSNLWPEWVLLDGNFNLAQHEKVFVNGVIFVTLIFMVEAFAVRCTRLCLVINSGNWTRERNFCNFVFLARLWGDGR